jgi:muramoyltetrapeptide carboxypeptidase
VSPRTKAGFTKFRPAGPGSRIAVIAPASPLDPAEIEGGVAELRRLGFDPVYDDDLFAPGPIVAGEPVQRAHAVMRAMTRPDVDAVVAVRGGYGSMETLPWLDRAKLAERRTALVGYSDITALHAYLNRDAGMASLHGPMLQGRLALGIDQYDAKSFLSSLSTTPLGELTLSGVEVIKGGEASGPIVGGCLTQIASSLGTPFAFRPPSGAVLFLEDVSERPYRVRRSLTQLQQAGVFESASAMVFGQMPRCDEPGGAVTARGVIGDFAAGFRGPVLYGFPSGHTTTPLVSIPFGVGVRVLCGRAPGLLFEEAAAE